ncbi:MAG: hypothetical protein J5626_01800 [Lachnospiraceae bacterium]|nr:hypothetical protein [Lachnospiraceae bacterium]
MNGQMKNYSASLSATPYKDYSDLLGIKIDYKKLIEYARGKGISPAELSDEEKNLFIQNSDMETIKNLRKKFDL